MSIGVRSLCCTAAFALLAALSSACDDSGRVRLISVFPSDEPGLFDAAGVVQIALDLYAADAPGDPPARSVLLARREELSLDGLGTGPWTIAIRGIDGAGEEVVYGRTGPFRIRAGQVTDVRIFLGRSRAFNRVALTPPETAAEIERLVGHTATPFTDGDGKDWILVAGGFRSGESASTAAYLVDPDALTVEKLGAAMARPHSGHAAIAVAPPGRAPVVVIADGAPVNTLEVYDTADRAFRPVDVPCGPEAFSGIAAAVEPGAGGALVPSGRVILPGAQLCVVDPYGERVAETWPSPTGAAPVAPAVSASNAAGQLVLVDAAGTAWAASAEERTAGADPCGADPAAVLEGLSPRAAARLLAVGGEDRFALLGGETAMGGVPASDWAVVSLDGCGISALEGSSGSDSTLISPAVLDLSGTGESEPALDLLVTGGSKREDSDLLVADSPDGLPLWYASAGDHTPAMRSPREGHAVAALSNRSAWVLGGGDDGSGAEIFELGSATERLGAVVDEFAQRRPVLTAMTVLDETGATDGLTALIEDNFLSMLFSDENTGRMAATVALFGSSDRGIGDGLDALDLPDNEHCAPNPVSEPSVINWGAVTGDTTGIDYPEGVDPANDNTEAIENARQAINNTMAGVKARSAADRAGEAFSADATVAALPAEITTCQWRQYARVGFDGLGWEGSHKDATYSGVNVLVWVVTGDDCSQGVYGTSNPDALPPEGTLGTTACGDPAMDPYFGLPPGSIAQWVDLGQVVKGLVWNPEDLLIAVVAKGDGEGALPRRLGETTDFMVNLGAELVPMLVESAVDQEAFAAQLDVLSGRIAARNPYQVCVPPEIVGDAVAPFSAGVGDEGLFLPIGTDNPWAESMLAAITADVAEGCRVLRVTPAGDGDGVTGAGHARVEEIEGIWRVATDTDRRAGCPRGWTVQIDSSEVSEDDALFVHCAPR